MIITNEVEITLSGKDISYYENLGYSIYREPAKYNNKRLIVPRGTKLLVRIEDLPLKSNIEVEVSCDYCGIVILKKYSEYTISREHINKDCCEKCSPLKIKESNVIKYGVDHTSQLDSTKEKNIKTNLKKYNATNPAKNNIIKEKIKQTNIERYGAVSPTLNKEIKAKQVSTMINKYGVGNSMQNVEIKKLAMNTMYENGTAPCSRQQKYIHNLIGGELNLPCKNLFLDIAFVDEKIYLEIDLGGHDLPIKLGYMSREDFESKERNRWYALYRSGWKEIRIISSKDKIPNDDKILEMISYAKEYLKTGRHYIKFYLDEGKVKTSQFDKNFDFEELRYVYKKDIASLNNVI